ncbi:hypothetical protein [Bradyrhizobium sp. CCBAU 51765]|uniref:hypothetical protein n=1 Tax=Bradyrhizobium sp. CCBAU 51765 TaxID=1325102 RepID=UPI001888F5A9|nr:hypothetical protein [Bradyrhizobium sp. CCBAU 51765]QOZ11770.1 hypothetical protein XH96_32930 [Bradyrhizobium sp. CCBAU 51765]
MADLTHSGNFSLESVFSHLSGDALSRRAGRSAFRPSLQGMGLSRKPLESLDRLKLLINRCSHSYSWHVAQASSA